MHFSKQQEELVVVQAFLNSEAVKAALNTTQSPLAAINVLKKICVHPNLLSERAADAAAVGGMPTHTHLLQHFRVP